MPQQVSEAASGVTYLHELGIAHGDIKAVRAVVYCTFCVIDASYRLTSSLTTQGQLELGISV